MASPATTTGVLAVLLLVALAAGGARAALFYITNQCEETVWPGIFFPKGLTGCGGTRLDPGQRVRFDMAPGTTGGRIWARTGCSFAGTGGRCATGDCAGAMCCAVYGKPATLAEFTIDGGDINHRADFYDISVVDGFNVPMDFRCIGGEPIRCRDPKCPGASHPNAPKVHTCRPNSDYEIVFCPQ
ncbi:hypothetical protein ACP4OV_018890 [Aristida adscensionis]